VEVAEETPARCALAHSVGSPSWPHLLAGAALHPESYILPTPSALPAMPVRRSSASSRVAATRLPGAVSAPDDSAADAPHGSRPEQVYLRLRDLIVQGRLAPGSR